MKYCRFLYEGQVHYGVVEERGGELWIVDLTPLPGGGPGAASWSHGQSDFDGVSTLSRCR